MKNLKIVTIITLLNLVSCSHMNSNKRKVASIDEEGNDNQLLHTTIMAKAGVKYKVEIFKPQIRGCFTEKSMNISQPEIVKNNFYENLNDNVQVAVVHFSANYGEKDNCKFSLAEGVVNFDFKRPTIVRIVEDAAYSYQLGGNDSQLYSNTIGKWTPGQEAKYDEFYKN
jgi:hypothetical protein